MNPAYQKIDGDFNQTIIVGDIHGCYEELCAQLEHVQFDSNDLLISVGTGTLLMTTRKPCCSRYSLATPQHYLTSW